MDWTISARDCLYLNWSVPRDALPAPPAPLRYEVHDDDGREVVFVSALLFHVEGARPRRLPWPRFSFPQLSLRAYALDRQGVPSILFLHLLMPWWVVPASRWLGRQPSRAAHLEFARPSGHPDREAWWWRVRAPAELRLAGRPGAGLRVGGVDLGSWEETVAYFRCRSRVYSPDERRLRQLRADEASTDPIPLSVRFEKVDLLRLLLPSVDPQTWIEPHSAWVCPEIPVLLALDRLRQRPAVRSLSTAAGG